MTFNKTLFQERFHYWINRASGDGLESADNAQIYEAVSRAIMDLLWEQWQNSERTITERQLKRIYYFSAEFLMGRALGNNLINLGILSDVRALLESLNVNLNGAEESECDAALGNGGLGRLAACFMESLASLNLPARGYGIRYRYGMFRQDIVAGEQKEMPDNWGARYDPWSVRRSKRSVTVRFGGRVVSELQADGSIRFGLIDTEDVQAIPYDMPIIGWDTSTVNTLRLWEAESATGFDLHLFNNMEYLRAVEAENRAQDLSRVLYPNDSGPTGKALRLRQQYFFSSASLQDILKEYKSSRGNDLKDIPSMAAIQLNDTHPVIAIPELMRLLMDEEGMGWDDAWSITTATFAYTNHTVLVEALEKWPIELFRTEFPRLIQIIEEINRRFLADLLKIYPNDTARQQRMSVFSGGMINMAHLAIIGSFSVNGVAALHTEILKKHVLKDWYQYSPRKFNNKTNGVTQRRWLKKANPALADFLDDTLGPEWTKNLDIIADLKAKSDDAETLERLSQIKAANKRRLAEATHKITGISVDPATLFDVQIKRLHEYKRQLLNILSVIHDWQALHDNPDWDIPPRTIFFGAKAASGYRRAKQIIHLIHAVAERINADPVTNHKLKVVFIPNYRVSIAELLFPAAEISQQISTAGKEASGTGNMKFMMNGAVTLGTMDGANIEIVEEAGAENAFIFGMSADEVHALRASGENNPWAILESEAALKRALNALVDKSFSAHDDFRELYDSLVYGVEGNAADEYFVLTDFPAYRDARMKANRAWKDSRAWNRMALFNIAGSGRFSSDRTIRDYARDIWGIVPL